MSGGGGGGAPAPKNPWDNLGVNTQQGYGTLQSGFNPGANIQQQGTSYAQLRNQGFADDAIRSSVQSVYGQQPQDWYAVRRAGGPYEGLGVNTERGFNTLVGAAGQTPAGSASAYNSLLRQGFGNETIRSSANELFGNQSDADWNDMVTQAGLAAGRPLPGSAQFYQPVYQQQYQNYNMGNPMSVSQYGQGFGGFNPYAMQMQTPFNPYTNSYGYGMQSPFSYMQQPQTNYGPAQQIVSRSAAARGTPNVMRRAEGGIASLVGDE